MNQQLKDQVPNAVTGMYARSDRDVCKELTGYVKVRSALTVSEECRTEWNSVPVTITRTG